MRLCGRWRKRSEQAELGEDFHGRGVDGVAAEIAEEVGVLLDHFDGDPGAGEQQPGHHPRGAPADDEDVGAHRSPLDRARDRLRFTKFLQLGDVFGLFRELTAQRSKRVVKVAGDVMTAASCHTAAPVGGFSPDGKSAR